MIFLGQYKTLPENHRIIKDILFVVVTFFLVSCGSKNGNYPIPQYEIAYSIRDSICTVTNFGRECFNSPLEDCAIQSLVWFKSSNDLLVSTETREVSLNQSYEKSCRKKRNTFSIVSDKGVFKRGLIEFDSLKRVTGYSLFGDTLLAVLIEDVVCEGSNRSIFYNPSVELYKIEDSVLLRMKKYSLSDSLNFFISESSWNPDGTEIVLSSNGFGVYILNILTGRLSKISYGGVLPIWNPKHDEIAYLDEGDLWFYECETSKSRLILKSGLLYDFSLASWHPSGDFILLAGASKFQIGIFSLPGCFWLNRKSGEIVEDKSCGFIDKSWK